MTNLIKNIKISVFIVKNYIFQTDQLETNIISNCFKQNMKQQEDNHYLTKDQALSKLNHCYSKMELSQMIPAEFFRQYIALYIQKQSLSQDYFIALCQHGVIQRLFGLSGKHLPSIEILEMFNLLLANTSQMSILVYLFSQPSVHEYLFYKFNILKENSEAVQYYIQLLKTIIMKISIHNNNSLIKLFCNNRYPSFPLLTMVTLLGTSLNRQVLVKITAHQCVLLLISLINEKQVGRGYLNDMQMIVFYFELTNDLVEKQKTDQEGLLKYLVDLIYALRNNTISLSFLLNTLTNVLIARHVNNITKIITFFTNLSQQIREYHHFPEQLSQQIMTTFSRIVNKIYFDHFINSTYLTTLKIIPKLQASAQPNLLKFFQERGKNISVYLLQYDKKHDNSHEKIFAFYGWRHFNDSSQQVINIKENKQKQKGGFFGFFGNKIDPTQKYIKTIMTIAGLNFDRIKLPLFKLSVCLNYQTALYISEQYMSKPILDLNGHPINSKSQSRIYEIHFNQYRGKFDFNSNMIEQLFRMIRSLTEKQINLFQKEQQIRIEDNGFYFQYYFIRQLRFYLTHSLSDHILGAQYSPKISQISLCSKLLSQLQICDQLQRKCKQKLLFKIQKLQQQIHELIFQNDFKYLIEYVLDKKYNKYIQSNFPKQQDIQIIGKDVILQDKIQRKIFNFQFLRTLVDSSMSSISQHIQDKWKEIVNISQDSNRYKIQWRDKFDNYISIEPNQNQGFKVKQIINQEAVIDFALEDIDCRLDEKGDYCIFFSPYNNYIELKNKQDAVNLSNQISRIQSHRQEIITKAILQYFQLVHSSLCRKVYKEKSRLSSK